MKTQKNRNLKTGEVPGWLVLFVGGAIFLSVSLSSVLAEAATERGYDSSARGNVIGAVWNGIAFKDAKGGGDTPLLHYEF